MYIEKIEKQKNVSITETLPAVQTAVPVTFSVKPECSAEARPENRVTDPRLRLQALLN
jgi:hypothetical protein